jgi:hypothetical protein
MSARVFKASGWTRVPGLLPAEYARNRPRPRLFSIASAMIERAELWVHTKRTL